MTSELLWESDAKLLELVEVESGMRTGMECAIPISSVTLRCQIPMLPRTFQAANIFVLVIGEDERILRCRGNTYFLVERGKTRRLTTKVILAKMNVALLPSVASVLLLSICCLLAELASVARGRMMSGNENRRQSR